MKEMIEMINIDLKVLSVCNININELFTLLKIYFKNQHKQLFDYEFRTKDIISLSKKKLLRISERDEIETYSIRGNAVTIIESCLNITLKETVEEKRYDIEDLVDVIREKFKGKKPGSMGDRNALKEKLINWKINNNEVTDDEILLAVDKYLDSVQNYTYLQRADYFISKRSGNVDTSRLSSYVEENNIPPENSDWGSSII